MTTRRKIGPHWFGHLDLDNLEEIAQAIRNLLEGKKFTFVSVSGNLPSVKVHTCQILAPEKAEHGQAVYTYRSEESGNIFAGFGVIDTYGSWGCYISATLDRRPYLSFEHNQVEITHFAPNGDQIIWIAAVEEDA